MSINSTLLKIRVTHCTLILYACLLMFGSTVSAQSGYLKRSPNSVEDLRYRDAYSSTFKNPDGSFTKEQFLDPIHYKNEKGNWVPIQKAPEKSQNDPRLIEMSRTDLPASINTANGYSQMFLTSSQKISFGSNARILWAGADQSVSRTIEQQTAIANYRFQNNEILLENVFPEIDRKQEMKYNRLRTDYVINQPLGLPAAVEYVIFEDYVSMPEGWKIDYASGEMTPAGWKGGLSIIDEKNMPAGTYSVPVFYDSYNSSSKSELVKHLTKGTYRFVKTGNGYRIQIMVPSKWLNDPERVYPVTIDPTVSGSIAAVGYVSGYAYDALCQENMVISVPAGTVTGTGTTYKITAQNDGFQEEQRSRIGCGGNWSADQSNTIASGGTYSYSITGLTIANRTTCGENITFTWQGYRTWDSDGWSDCDDFNQYRTDWGVTVTYTAAGGGSIPASVGWTADSGASPTAPACGDWSNTWCAGSGTYTSVSLTQGVNYTFENTGAASCGPAMATAYLQSWWSGGTTACGWGAIDSPGTNSISFNGAITGGHIVSVTTNACGSPNSCGGGLGYDFSGSSAVLRYRQNTTVANTTSTADICLSNTKTLSATLGGSHNNPAISWSVIAGSGSISGNTFTPSAAGPVTVRATVGNCSSDISFNVTSPASTPVTISGTTSICEGGSTVLTASGGSTYSWSPATGLDATTGASVTANPASTQTYTVTETSGSCMGPQIITVTVNGPPTASIMASSASICQGETAVLTASGGTSYSWSPATGLNATTGAVVNATPGSTQAYTVTVTDGNNCTDSEIITVNVTPLVVSVGSDVSSICAGESATLTASGAVSYTWSPATGLSATTGDQVTATPTSTQTYTVTGTDGSCSGSQNIMITVKTNPTVTVNPLSVNFCSGGTVSLTASGASSYIWLPILVSGATVSVSPTATTTYTVFGTAANGCVGQGTSTVNVTNPPNASVSYAGSPFCTNSGSAQPVTLTGTTGGTYSSAAGLSINATTGAIMPSTSTPATYTVTYTVAASGGCPVFTTTTSATVSPIPTASISYAGSPFCGNQSAQPVSLTGTAGGTYTSAGGLSIDATTGEITPSASTPGTYTVTYTIAAASGCPVVTATTSVTITTPPAATISYTGLPFCTNLSNAQPVTFSGTTGGTYSSTGGLSINTSTGAITPSTSTDGTYTVTYTIAAAGGCPVFTTTTSVTISPIPTASISYAGSPFCGNQPAQPVSLTGTAGGTYTSIAGLSIDATTGAVTPSASTPGAYTVTYTIAAASGCPAVTATASVTITTPPAATISYAGSPFCMSLSSPQAVTQTGTTGGAYSSTGGLSINASTGAITPSTSTDGSYTVTYTIAAAGGCPVYTATAPVTVNAIPTATITYPGSPFCGNAGSQPVTQTGAAGGVYTSVAGLSIDATTGAVIPSASTPGTYTVTYAIAAASGCPAVTATASVTITTPPTATISYAGSPFCISNATAQPVTRTGTAGGVYSSTGGLSINASTGAITPSSSTAATYTVTYTIAAAAGCPVYTTTTSVTVNPIPAATISYPGSPFCGNLGSQPVTQTGTTGGIYSSVTGLTIDATTGAVTPSTSTPGTYTVTYTIPASGCPSVTATTSVTINALPAATISYAGSPFCKSVSAAQPVTQSGTTGGTYSSTGGLSINASTGAITPSTSTAGGYMVTYTMAASGGCPVVTATAAVTVNAIPTAAISYPGSPFCGNSGAQAVTQTGTTGGTYSSVTGLTINATTGTITPSTSTAGTYTVTYTIAAASGCPAVTATASVTINAVPTAVISYPDAQYCSSIPTPQAVVVTGTAGGTFSSAAGLALDASTGAITPSGSTPGNYTVTYNVSPAGCAMISASTAVEIVLSPTANISYAGPYCASVPTAQPVTLNGTGNYLGGSYSASPPGLNISASTGGIVPNLSTAGIYIVTYTVPASSGCSAGTATANVTITATPSAVISYDSPFCSNLTGDQVVTFSGVSGGTFSAPTGLSINASTGAITPSASTAGIYVVTYITPVSGSCPPGTATSTVEIIATPDVSDLADQMLCDLSYTLPVISGTALSGSEMYYTGTGATGVAYAAGDVLTTSATLYIFDANGVCSDEETVSITINQTPVIINPGNQVSCGPYTLPVIGGTNLSGSEAYYNNSQALGGTVISGSVTTSQTVWIYDENGTCADEESFTVTINAVQDATFTASDYCGASGTAPVITGTAGGTFSFNPAVADGATIDPATGLISNGVPGTSYTIEYALSGACPVSSQETVTVNAVPASPGTGSDMTYCSSDVSATMTATANSGGTLNWFNDAALTTQVGTGTSVVPSNTVGLTTYYVTETVNGCQSAPSTINVTVNASPAVPDAGADVSYCFGDSIYNLQATGSAGNIFKWYFDPGLTDLAGTGDTLLPANQIGSATYYLTQTGTGCESTAAAVTVTINDCFEIEVPTAFTPADGDNVNNTWEIIKLNEKYPNNKVTVFDRWGQYVFKSDGYAVPWDGKYKGEDLPVGSYYYIIELNDADNTPKLTGTVSIIRN